jgi:hypothetical protein
MRRWGGSGGVPQGIPLTSMMDLFTIVLLFLIKSYSASGSLVMEVDQLELPASNINTTPREALSIVVDSGRLSGVAGVFTESGGERQELLDDAGSLLGQAAGAAAFDPRSMILRGLENFLLVKAAEARDLETRFGIPFQGEITIQADAAVDYNSILKVLATCGSAGFNMTEFVVVRSSN